MDSCVAGKLAGWETHGFPTMEDLDINRIEEEAHSRWLRPNEIYAVLCNYKQFNISAKPLDSPASGTLILFDRKALRNFRKDGHAWQKKKDGKTVKEAHEHLKVGNEERIHVYYAHGEENPKFVRRSYWLLERAYEHIVLVHYREVSEVNTKPIVSPQGGATGRSYLSKRISPMPSLTAANSSSSSGYSEKPISWVSSEEFDSRENASVYAHLAQTSGFNMNIGDGGPQLIKWNNTGNADNCNARTESAEDLTIHQINTLDWEQLVEPQDSSEEISYENIMENHQNICAGHQKIAPEVVYWEKHFQNDAQSGSTPLVEHDRSEAWGSELKDQNQLALLDQHKMVHNQWVQGSNLQSPLLERVDHSACVAQVDVELSKVCELTEMMNGNSFKKQDSFGRWLSSVLDDSPSIPEWPNGDYKQVELDSHATVDQSLVQGQVFCITEVSPLWAFSTEETKVIITGYFVEAQKDIVEAKWYCVFGEAIVPAEVVQVGVFRCKTPPHAPGMVNLFLTCNDRVPNSQILSFEYRVNKDILLDRKSSFAQTEEEVLEEFALQIRFAHLIFSSFKGISSLVNKKTEQVMNMERIITMLFANNEREWLSFPKSVTSRKKSLEDAKSHLLELFLKKKLQEWILEKVVEKDSAIVHDSYGQGVIHLAAALGYEWVVIPIKFVGMSLDFRDKCGWTALHWAAVYRRERMVAALLAAGANASLVSDPTPEFPGGLTPADLASKKGYEGLAGYLAEKALTTHLENLTLYDKNDPRKQTYSSEFETFEYLPEDEQCMRDSLAAVRTATEAAAKIQSAFREHSFKLKVKAFELADHGTAKDEALKMIAALRIQRAYREHQERRQIVAARRIQHVFRGWKTRKDFINLRRKVIKIQAHFRGHQVRKQYRKILWSVGILEKAILRWRLKRKGLRGLQVDNGKSIQHAEQEPESDNIEDFFRIGRKYAEERVERSVIRVQAMYRSYRARGEYRRMKQCHNQAQLQYNQIADLDINMEPRD